MLIDERNLERPKRQQFEPLFRGRCGNGLVLLSRKNVHEKGTHGLVVVNDENVENLVIALRHAYPLRLSVTR
jgi:hypothetical protein